MIEKEIVKQFLGKYVVFSWLNYNKQIFSKGIVKGVTETSMVIEFQGKLQVYSLNSIISIREVEK